MRRAKISIIGAGNVGATTAHWCAAAELGDVERMYRCLDQMEAGTSLGLFASPFDAYHSDPRFQAHLEKWNLQAPESAP